MAIEHPLQESGSQFPTIGRLSVMDDVLQAGEAQAILDGFIDLRLIPYNSGKAKDLPRIEPLNAVLDRLANAGHERSAEAITRMAYLAAPHIPRMSHIVVDGMPDREGKGEHRDSGLPHMGIFAVANGEVTYVSSSRAPSLLGKEPLDTSTRAKTDHILVANNMSHLKRLRGSHLSKDGTGDRVGMRFLAYPQLLR